MGDELLSVIKSGVGVLGMKGEDKPTLVVVVTPDLVKKGIHAGNIAKEIGQINWWWWRWKTASCNCRWTGF